MADPNNIYTQIGYHLIEIYQSDFSPVSLIFPLAYLLVCTDHETRYQLEKIMGISDAPDDIRRDIKNTVTNYERYNKFFQLKNEIILSKDLNDKIDPGYLNFLNKTAKIKVMDIGQKIFYISSNLIFKQMWKNKFKEDNQGYLHQDGEFYGYFDDNFILIKIPLEHDYSLILTNKTNNLMDYLDKLDKYELSVSFKNKEIWNNLNLTDFLKKNGLSDIFDENKSDFTNFFNSDNKNEKLSINEIKQSNIMSLYRDGVYQQSHTATKKNEIKFDTGYYYIIEDVTWTPILFGKI